VTISGHLLENFVAVIKRRWHQIRGFVGGVTKHDTLVASAFVLVAGCVDALRDMCRLAVEVVHESQCFMMETGLFVADFLYSAADGCFNFFFCAIGPCAIFVNALTANFTGKHDELRGRQRFAGDAGFGVF
jgi:hypothetical protein